MHCVPLAPAAVLLELDPVRGVPLGLLRLVVPPLALRAGERDCDSDSSGHFSVSNLEVDDALSSGGWDRTTDTRLMKPLL